VAKSKRSRSCCSKVVPVHGDSWFGGLKSIGQTVFGNQAMGDDRNLAGCPPHPFCGPGRDPR